MTVTDLPDYTSEIAIRHLGGFIGLEELATRLGFIAPFDLRGNVVLMEDFESELTEWADESDGAGCTATRSSRHKYSGDRAVKLLNAGGAGKYAIITRYLAFPGVNKQVAFARFCADEDIQLIALFLRWRTGARDVIVEAKYNHLLDKLTIETSDAEDYVVATELNLTLGTHTWFPFYFTYDLSTGYYGKVSIMDREFDVSTIPINIGAAVTSRYGLIEAYAEATQTGAFTVYVDDIVLAKNVP